MHVPVTDLLAREIEYFEENRERLLGEALGKYVLIHGDEVGGIYDTERDAVMSGYQKYGNTPFLVKRAVPVDEPANFLSGNVRIA